MTFSVKSFGLGGGGNGAVSPVLSDRSPGAVAPEIDLRALRRGLAEDRLAGLARRFTERMGVGRRGSFSLKDGILWLGDRFADVRAERRSARAVRLAVLRDRVIGAMPLGRHVATAGANPKDLGEWHEDVRGLARKEELGKLAKSYLVEDPRFSSERYAAWGKGPMSRERSPATLALAGVDARNPAQMKLTVQKLQTLLLHERKLMIDAEKQTGVAVGGFSRDAVAAVSLNKEMGAELKGVAVEIADVSGFLVRNLGLGKTLGDKAKDPFVVAEAAGTAVEGLSRYKEATREAEKSIGAAMAAAKLRTREIAREWDGKPSRRSDGQARTQARQAGRGGRDMLIRAALDHVKALHDFGRAITG